MLLAACPASATHGWFTPCADFCTTERLWPAGYTAEWEDDKHVRFISSITETPSGPMFRCGATGGAEGGSSMGPACHCPCCWWVQAFARPRRGLGGPRAGAEPAPTAALLIHRRIKAQRLAHEGKEATEVVELGAGPTPDDAYKVGRGLEPVGGHRLSKFLPAGCSLPAGPTLLLFFGPCRPAAAPPPTPCPPLQDAEERQSEALEIALLNRSVKHRGGAPPEDPTGSPGGRGAGRQCAGLAALLRSQRSHHAAALPLPPAVAPAGRALDAAEHLLVKCRPLAMQWGTERFGLADPLVLQAIEVGRRQWGAAERAAAECSAGLAGML